MKIRSGHIPADIVYIFAGSDKVTNRWDDADQNDDELKFTTVVPAFVSDADNEKTIATGKHWAESRATTYDHTAKKSVKIAVVQELQRENQPIENVRIVSLEHRGNGGRAYKVVTPDDYYFDLREDVLMDTMLSDGIAPGGILKGTYVWARVAAEMKLVRVGSALYNALLEAGERAIMSAVPKGKLKVGTVYETKQGDRGLFLGYVSTEDWSLKWPNGKSTWNNRYYGSMYGNKSTSKDQPTLVSKPYKKHLLWFKMSAWTYAREKVDPSQKLFQDAMAESELNYGFSLGASHSMVKEVSTVPVPSDVIEQVRLKAVTSYKDRMSKVLGTKQPGVYSSGNYQYEKEETIVNASAMCLMRPVGDPAPTVDEPNFQAMTIRIGHLI
jgi:hypothetical protein